MGGVAHQHGALGQRVVSHRQYQRIDVALAGLQEATEAPAEGLLQAGQKGGVIERHQGRRLIPRHAPDQGGEPPLHRQQGQRPPLGETLECLAGRILGRLDGGDDGALAVVVAAHRQLALLAHEGVAAIGRHQQTGLITLAVRQSQVHPLRQRLHPFELGRAQHADLRAGGDRLLQLDARRRQLDHLAEGRQAILRRRQAGLAEVAPIRHMNLGDGAAMGSKTGPEPVPGQRLAGAGGERDGAGIEAGVCIELGGARLQQQDLQGLGPWQGREGERQHGAAHSTTDDGHIDVVQIRLRHEMRGKTENVGSC